MNNVIPEQKEMSVRELGDLVVTLHEKLDSKVDRLAEATANGFQEVHERIDSFEADTKENFAKVRQDIFNIKDNYATKVDLEEVKKLL